ncbi:MAG: sigma-70 family RNA polymerase sigma factor [Clostridia bacterium]|nr:sigma-70 family RNA polymerase sigma factor [Clostridia bacterium]
MDEETYITLSQVHMPAMYRVACSILGSRADAEDAVQQTLLLAWQHRSKARPGLEKPWMMRILVNTSRSMLRKRRPSIPIEEVPLAAPEAGDEALREAIHALPEKLRTPLLLKYMEGMTEKEVAAAVGLPLSQVKGRLFRARRLLRHTLREEADL